MRRGRSYGHRAADPRVHDGVERGLHFICLNADIERQFEFVQQTWINSRRHTCRLYLCLSIRSAAFKDKDSSIDRCN